MLTERDIDRQIAINRDAYYRACTVDLCEAGDKPCPDPSHCVIDTSPRRLRLLLFFSLYRFWRGAGHTVMVALRFAYQSTTTRYEP
jgi:hypothetical protein